MSNISKIIITVVDDGEHLEIFRRCEDATGERIIIKDAATYQKLDPKSRFLLSVSENGLHSMNALIDLTIKANTMAEAMLNEGKSEEEITAAVKALAPAGMETTMVSTSSSGDDALPEILH